MSDKKGWIAVDFDGTLALFAGNFTVMGAPIPRMVQRVRQWLRDGYEVRIFTARIAHKDPVKRQAVIDAIQEWCVTHIGVKLEVTNVKDFNMVQMYDDKAVQVIKNTGWIITMRGIKR